MNSRNLLLSCFLVSLALTTVLGCHVSCDCNPDSNICVTCKDPHSELDANNRSCPCNLGYFTSTLNPFQCEQYLHKDANGNDISLPLESCAVDIADQTKGVIIKIQSKFYTDSNDQQGYVEVHFSLDFSHVSISAACQAAFTQVAQYKVGGNWVNVDPSEISVDANGKTVIKILLIKLYDYSETSVFNTEQIAQTLHFQNFLGLPNKFVRVHQWDLFVYTNRKETETFTVDVDIQTTSGCLPGNECIVVADLETLSQVCGDATCATVRANNVFQIAEIFYAKIWFADATYTKHLQFVSAYTKNSQGAIYNVTPIVTASPDNWYIIVSLPMTESGTGILIQFNFLISENRLRNLATSTVEQQTSSVQLKANVVNGTVQPLTTSSSSHSASSTLLLASGTLASLLLLVL